MIPEPQENEAQGAFIVRCMSDLDSEFGDRDQRAAVCYRQWRGVKGKSLTDVVPDKPDASVRLEKRCKGTHIELGGKLGPDDSGWLEGYASVFGVVDKQGDVVMPGAFAKTIAERVPAGKVKLMLRHYTHGGDVLEVAGVVTEAREDEYGLWIHAEFSASAGAQTARGKVAEGLVSGLSMGYSTIRAGKETRDATDVTLLHELKLWEVTLTALPANELAAVTACKALADEASAEILESKTISPATRRRIEDGLAELSKLTGLDVSCKDRSAPAEGTEEPAAPVRAKSEAVRAYLSLTELLIERTS